MVDKIDEGRVTVDIDGAAMILLGGSLLTTSVGESTRGAADALVTADLVAGLLSLAADGLMAIRPVADSLRSSRSSMLFSKEAGSALRTLALMSGAAPCRDRWWS